MLPITEITPFTFQDFPGYTACIIWFGGCNFRCPYCHNPEFLENFKTIKEEKVFDFLESRKELLEGVVLSGGECTLSNDLIHFIEKVKKIGFKIKIDTNGTNPVLVSELLDKELLDFVALDYKAPEYKFGLISKSDKYSEFDKTLDLLIESQFPLEIRTTVHTKFLQEDDINEILKDLDKRKYRNTYYVQNYKNENCKTLENLEKQDRLLDRAKLLKPKNFVLEFRNFW